MYAIFSNGGKQYKAKKGKYLKLEKISNPKGSNIIFDTVLMICKKNKTYIGKPIIPNVKIEALIINHQKNKKIKIIKFHRRKHYKKKQGHRQSITIVKIINIKD